jgi:arabinogalactan oligomer/maltooligosaccharide transport system permease protein
VPASPSHRLRFVAALAAALATGGGIAELLLRGAEQEHREELASRRAVVALGSLVDLVARSGATGDRLRELLRGWQEGQPAGREARVILLQGARLEGSTAAADAGEGAAPRRLARDEKPLYDQAQRLRGAVESNREGGAPKPEFEIERLAGGARIVAAPLRAGDEVVGAVRLTVPPPPATPRTSRLAGVAWLVAAFATFCAAALSLGERRWPLALAAAACLAAGLGLEGRASLSAMIAALRPDQLALAVVEKLDPAAADRELLALRAEATRALAATSALALAVLAFVGLGGLARTWRALVVNRQAYAYVAPAVLGTLVLVFFPFFYGVALGFTDSNIYNTSSPLSEIWVGLRNYAAILGDFSMVKRGADGALVWNYLNFYWTLLFTVVWTISNVTFGVTFGLLLALVLDTKGLALRPAYRVLLILPWAMPNYITALIWKGMFHRQFGVVNQVLQLFGAQPLSWFDQPFTSFLTALATNGWLSFPFMMVVSLGALQSIPADLYEAARVDGASRWQQFLAITLPSLRPALVPAVILSVVWTFNMFNIIYLVTAGAPNGATEILITQAYKFAFERYRYGYAAAYSVVIFGILLVYGGFQNRVTKATEGI